MRHLLPELCSKDLCGTEKVPLEGFERRFIFDPLVLAAVDDVRGAGFDFRLAILDTWKFSEQLKIVTQQPSKDHLDLRAS